jgi:hypothetical protein
VGFPAITLLHLDHALRSTARTRALGDPMTVCLTLQKCGFSLIPLQLRWANQSPMTGRIPKIHRFQQRGQRGPNHRQPYF